MKTVLKAEMNKNEFMKRNKNSRKSIILFLAGNYNTEVVMEDEGQEPKRPRYDLRSLGGRIRGSLDLPPRERQPRERRGEPQRRPMERRGALERQPMEAVRLSEAQVKDRPDVEFGGKVFLPEDVLSQRLMFFEDADESQVQQQQPLLFKLESQDKEDVVLHCGVWEFTAEAGQVQVPGWMMDRLGGGRVLVSSVELPKAKTLTVRPVTDDTHEGRLMDLPDLKTILETRLKSFSALTAKDVVPVEFAGSVYLMEVVAATPADSVDITETNVEIEFALSPEEEKELKDRMDDFYWTNWQPGQGLRFFRPGGQ